MSDPKSKSAKTKNEPKKVFDVERPSKTAPPSTSRPVIVKNRSIMKDPMMVADSIPDGTEKEEQSLKTAPKKININPPADEASSAPDATTVDNSAKADSTETKTKTTEVAGPPPVDGPTPSDDVTSDTKAEDQPVKSLPSDDAKEKPEEAPSSDTTDKISSGKSDAKKDIAEVDKAAEEEAERQAKLDKLVESGQYFLPVNAVKKRRVRNTLIVVIIIVILALIWLDLALDSGLIHINGLSPVTHFFKY
jgi:hypothetical protein